MNITLTIEGKTCNIRNDGTQFVPSFTSPNMGNQGDKDREVTRDLGYFSNLGNAVRRLITEVMASDESTITLAQYVTRYEKAVKEVQGILDNLEQDSGEINELDEL